MNKENSIASDVFNKFYGEFKSEGYSVQHILANFLPDFIEDISESWGEELRLELTGNNNEILGSIPLFEIHLNYKFFGVITENGVLLEAKKETKLTGGVTWNGDDEYFNEIGIEYTRCKKLDVIENLSELNDKTELTTELMENISCEIVSTVCQ